MQIAAKNKLVYTYNRIYHSTTHLKSLNIHGCRVNRHESNGAKHPPCKGAIWLFNRHYFVAELQQHYVHYCKFPYLTLAGDMGTALIGMS